MAAGEAQIESSVMGNVGKTPDSDVDALRSRSQVETPVPVCVMTFAQRDIQLLMLIVQSPVTGHPTIPT